MAPGNGPSSADQWPRRQRAEPRIIPTLAPRDGLHLPQAAGWSCSRLRSSTVHPDGLDLNYTSTLLHLNTATPSNRHTATPPHCYTFKPADRPCQSKADQMSCVGPHPDHTSPGAPGHKKNRRVTSVSICGAST
ncbi:unnamed protein product [Pleuronectes platessa]|uniref:Uncharacterized protein n=1 Tax=Pleuronectes platessa TaxID=8262 RepID=A0A9N7U7Z8_PLEPL|nr:unnamed protein product [Pleuronectes platessa]